MATRKVQIAGGSTYTVSLPKQWATEHGIEAGARLHLAPRDDGSLLIHPDRGNPETRETARIDIEGYSRADLVRTVRALYAVGFDAFALRTRTSLGAETRRAVTATAATLIGLEVTEESNTRLVLRSPLDATDVSIRRTVIRLRLVALSMQRDAARALGERDRELATDVIERDDEADRLFGLIDRGFQRALTDLGEVDRLGLDRPTLFSYYTTARNLERIADHAEKVATLATRIESVPDGIAGEILSLARRSHAVVEDGTSVLLAGGDVDDAYGTLAARDDLSAEIDAFDRRLYHDDVPDAYLFGLVLDSVKRTAEYGGNIAEAAIQGALRETASVAENRRPH